MVAPGLDTDKTTQWYNTPYSINPIPQQTVEKWQSAALNPNIVLPTRNEFLPDDLALKENGVGNPIKLLDTPKLTIWHRTDSSYGVPRANFRATIHAPAAVKSAKAQVLRDIYARMINEQLNEFSYAANLAGLSGGLIAGSRGFLIEVGGYSDGQQQMIEKISHAMINPEFDKNLFEQVVTENLDSIRNSQEDAPYKRTGTEFQKMLLHPFVTDEKREQALKEVTIDDLHLFAKEVLQQLRVIVMWSNRLVPPS